MAPSLAASSVLRRGGYGKNARKPVAASQPSGTVTSMGNGGGGVAPIGQRPGSSQEFSTTTVYRPGVTGPSVSSGGADGPTSGLGAAVGDAMLPTGLPGAVLPGAPGRPRATPRGDHGGHEHRK